KNKKARQCRALKSKECEGLPGTFAEPSNCSKKQHAETTQRKNTRFGHSRHFGGEISQGSIDLPQTPCASAVPLPEVIKTGPDRGRAIQQKPPRLTRAEV